MKIATKVCFAVLASLLVVPLVACGGGAPPTTPPPPTPTGNQPPKITSLTAEATTLLLNTETKITCNVSEPDGDVLTYKWEANGGDITGTLNNIAVWQAPNFTGKFIVKVTVSDKDGADYKSLELSVLANRPPVISSLTAVPARLQRGETSTITCLASDPDGDVLTATSYTWTISGGTLTGTGPAVTWKAPDSLGNFTVSVTVNDGKGGTTESICTIVVATPEVTVILTPLASESGSIYYGDGIISSFRIGDNAKNVGVRPYFSYDITGLVGATIKEAKLSFTVKEIVDNPWGSFVPPYLYFDTVDYGARALQAPDFSLVQSAYTQRESFSSQIPNEVDVKLYLTRALEPPIKPRFQVRLRLQPENGTDFNGKDNYIELNPTTLTVTYVK
jgi:hypothetical protein